MFTEYTICLKPDVASYAIHTPRKVPLTLKNKNNSGMEELGAILEVSEPTKWCVRIMGIPKASGKAKYELR